MSDYESPSPSPSRERDGFSSARKKKKKKKKKEEHRWQATPERWRPEHHTSRCSVAPEKRREKG